MEAAKELEEKFEAPEWTEYAKTGSHKERPPQQENWYHIRSAAILRKIYMDGPLGTSKTKNDLWRKKKQRT